MDVMRERGIYYGPIKIISGGGGEQQVVEAGSVTDGYVSKEIPGSPSGVRVDVNVTHHLEAPTGPFADVELRVFRSGVQQFSSGGKLHNGERWPLIGSEGINIYHEPVKE